MASDRLSYSSPLDDMTKGSLECLCRIVNIKIRMDAMDAVDSRQQSPMIYTSSLNSYIFNTLKALRRVVNDRFSMLYTEREIGLVVDIEKFVAVKEKFMQCQMFAEIEVLDDILFVLTSLLKKSG